MPFKITADSPAAALEFRASDDDAWYAADLFLDGEILTVRFVNFGPEFDEKFRPSDFEDEASVQAFKERFRPVSLQLQDAMCRKAIRRMTVCASHVFLDGAVKFYDALIDDVVPKDHAFEKGEEVCLCQFVLIWQHGPNDGLKTSTAIENVCLMQVGRVAKDPALNSFLEVTRKKLQLGSQQPHSIAECEISTCNAEPLHEICRLTGKKEFYRPQKSQNFKEKKNSRQGQTTETFKGCCNVQKKFGQDMDLGSEYAFTKHLKEKSDWFYIVIDNIEKDLSSSCIVDFIHQHASIVCHAYVSPSLSSEAYARGTIFLESREKFEKLYGFLWDPFHLILSSEGRPWVIVEKGWRTGAFEGLTQVSKKSSLKNVEDVTGKIKVVHKGTREYEKGKQLAELFTEFFEHLQPLHKRLLLEERNVMQSTSRGGLTGKRSAQISPIQV